VLGARSYKFKRWSDGKQATRTILATGNTPLTARFKAT
jgi:hypothetical protein